MMFMTPKPPVPIFSTPMKPSTSFSPITMPRVNSSVFAEPQLRSARSSAGLKLASLPSSSDTCFSAFAPCEGSTACQTMTSLQG